MNVNTVNYLLRESFCDHRSVENHPLIFRYIKTAFRYMGLNFKGKLAI